MSDAFVPDHHDPELDELLQTLGHFAPSEGFERRVMTRVRVPSPFWLQRLQARSRSFVESKRAKWIARGLVTSSVISITLVVSLLVANSAQVSALLGSQFGGMLLGMWRGLLGLGSTAARALYSAVGAGAVSGMVLLSVGFAILAVMVFNTWALYRLMQPSGATGYSSDTVRP